ncbi:hypothetical protein PGB90_006345 [Kerria lacca]
MTHATVITKPGADSRSDSCINTVSNVNQFNISLQTPAHIVKSFPNKNQEILMPSLNNIEIIDYVVSISRIFGPNRIISASKISKKRVCIYLGSEKTVDNFVNLHKSITIDDKLLLVRKLIAPARKLILSNVHSCLPNSVILDALRSHNIKPMSSIFDLHIGISSKKYNATKLQLYSHINSFRRGIYIADNADVTLPNSLLINFGNETYRIFVNDSDLPCHLCLNLGHSAAQCTEKLDDNSFVTSDLTELTTFEIEPESDIPPLLT